jgi:hypothetical protein
MIGTREGFELVPQLKKRKRNKIVQKMQLASYMYYVNSKTEGHTMD